MENVSTVMMVLPSFRGQFSVRHVNQLGIHDLLDFTNLHLIR